MHVMPKYRRRPGSRYAGRELAAIASGS